MSTSDLFMDFFQHKKKPTTLSLVVFSVAILFVTLFFGLRPGDYSLTNSVNWITAQPGIHFSKYGIAYTNPIFESTEDDIHKSTGFSIEIALKPESNHKKGFNFILAVHSGKDSDQLLIGQWRSWIIVMNGDDYDHTRRTKRISVNMASMSPSTITQFLTVTTGKEGTKVYFNGQLAHIKKDLTLKIPNDGKARLLVGNSVYGRHSWSGDIYGLAFYGKTLPAQDIARHSNRWFKDQTFLFAKKENPFVLYLFDEKGGSRALDHAGKNHHLQIPSRMQILKKEILLPVWKGLEFNRSSIQDIIINLVGFIPFGFILIATLINLGGTFQKHCVLITVALGFTFSLIIEIVQALMPSRSSQLLDLLLNTLSALIGTVIYKKCYKKWGHIFIYH